MKEVIIAVIFGILVTVGVKLGLDEICCTIELAESRPHERIK